MRTGNVLTLDVSLDALVRQHRGSVAVDFVTDGHVLAQHGHVLHTCPPAYGAVPTDDSALDPGMLLDLAAR